MCIQLATYTSLSKGVQTYKNLIIEYRDMFIYSKTSTFRNNSGIPWDNWSCSCFTCCYRCSLGNHHSLWALARFILSLNCWLFCWFLLKSQIHRRIHRIFLVEKVFYESFCETTAAPEPLCEASSPLAVTTEMLLDHLRPGNFPLGTGQNITPATGENPDTMWVTVTRYKLTDDRDILPQ